MTSSTPPSTSHTELSKHKTRACALFPGMRPKRTKRCKPRMAPFMCLSAPVGCGYVGMRISAALKVRYARWLKKIGVKS